MGYYINLASISLDSYKERLKNRYLVPSRQLLKENIDSVFTSISKQGILNVEDLLKALNNKKKLEAFSTNTSIPIEYLTVLAREIKSNITNPIKLKDFPNISSDVIQKLEEIGIKNTLQLYDRITTRSDRKELSEQIHTDEALVLKLAQLTDLSRIRWVNYTFANVLYEVGYKTIDSIVKADFNRLYEEIKDLNKEKQLFKGNIGLNDVKLLVEVAADVPQEIEY